MKFSYGIVASMALAGCQQYVTPAPPAPQTLGDLTPPPSFVFDQVTRTDRIVALETSGGESYPNGVVDLLDPSGQSIQTGYGDETGRVRFSVVENGQAKRLRVRALGFPDQALLWDPKSQETVLRPDSWTESVQSTARIAARRFASGPNDPTLGVPDNLDVQRRKLATPNVLSDISLYLPEGKTAKTRMPTLFLKTTPGEVDVAQEGPVWAVFLGESAERTHSVVWSSRSPGSKSWSEWKAAFPNASLWKSGGGLQAGDAVLLDKFTIGTTLRLAFVVDGWNGKEVSKATPVGAFEADPSLRQAIMSYYPSNGWVINSLEESVSGKGDDDFNDVVVALAGDSPSTFKQGSVPSLTTAASKDSDDDTMPDAADAFPFDNQRVGQRFYPSPSGWATMAWEDQWPSKGDYDFNDVVFRYRISEETDILGKVVAVQWLLEPLAMGAELRTGLAFGLGNPGGAVDSARVRIGQGAWTNKTVLRGPGSAAVFRLNDDLRALFDTTEGLVNTEPGGRSQPSYTFEARVRFQGGQNLPAPPYNPFLYRRDDAGWEIHMANQAPTWLAKAGLSGTADDAKGKFYRTATGLPWGMNCAGSWAWPKEGVNLLSAYPLFGDWVNSGGVASTDWTTRNVSKDLIYSP